MSSLIITIDTEGDGLWDRPRTVTTENARFLPRFQALCERYGFKPVWLTNWEMANDAAFCEMARDAITRREAEVGMHLHAWNTPPIEPLTRDDDRFHPYLIEYPLDVMRQKVLRLTELLVERFGVAITSHRAGRWAFNAAYARLLISRRYTVDCSVTPNVSWRSTMGVPLGRGGPDYRRFPARPYFVDPWDVSRHGSSPLLEVPVTIVRGPRRAMWLRPRGDNLREMLAVLRYCKLVRRPCAQFMLHSSELMPGGSPTFRDARAIERLYDDLEALFDTARGLGFRGETLASFRARY